MEQLVWWLSKAGLKRMQHSTSDDKIGPNEEEKEAGKFACWILWARRLTGLPLPSSG